MQSLNIRLREAALRRSVRRNRRLLAVSDAHRFASSANLPRRAAVGLGSKRKVRQQKELPALAQKADL
jgi:hypothetical protein